MEFQLATIATEFMEWEGIDAQATVKTVKSLLAQK